MAEPSPEIAHRVAFMRDRAIEARYRGQHLVYVRIPQPLGPADRMDRYQMPLSKAFAATRLGAVTGGGQQLGVGRTIVYCGLDVHLTDRGTGMDFLQESLHRLGAPPSTIIEEFLPEFREHPLGISEA